MSIPVFALSVLAISRVGVGKSQRFVIVFVGVKEIRASDLSSGSVLETDCMHYRPLVSWLIVHRGIESHKNTFKIF